MALDESGPPDFNLQHYRAEASRHSGADQFKLLRKCADDLCVNMAQRWDISPELLEAQIPAITKLKSQADPPTKPNPAPLVGLGLVAAAATFLGVLSGLISVVYHLDYESRMSAATFAGVLQSIL